MRFSVDWLTTEHGSPAERATFAALRLDVGAETLTEVFDAVDRTAHRSTRVSLVPRRATEGASKWLRLQGDREAQ